MRSELTWERQSLHSSTQERTGDWQDIFRIHSGKEFNAVCLRQCTGDDSPSLCSVGWLGIHPRSQSVLLTRVVGEHRVRGVWKLYLREQSNRETSIIYYLENILWSSVLLMFRHPLIANFSATMASKSNGSQQERENYQEPHLDYQE